ncbi:DUF2785 domain-containing protein [Clostridium sp. UBA4548]|uniref:DUF2785 domain-containing protein n=1 Tax=Clostridium sp. UBA4548 TaxID=1946361 RepID=UPI0025BC2AFB|nr:DUF2785 domain-containing protein [Clostridium sp. UBA4548]
MNDIKEKLILDLRRIRENKDRINPDENIQDYVDLMLKYIGDTNFELRERLITSMLCNWIIDDYITEEDIKKIFYTVIREENLLYGIGKENDDSVYTRSISVLLAACILFRHLQKSIFKQDEFVLIKDKLIEYYSLEKDFRGYDHKNGWIHTAAHGADALGELALCIETDELVHKEILTVIKKVILNGRYTFTRLEDERIATTITKILSRGLIPYEYFKNWLEGLCACSPNFENWDKEISSCSSTKKFSPIPYRKYNNIRNLIRSLYFRLIHEKDKTEITDALIEIEKRLNAFIED